ncbi:MAG: winged helix-turn-helix domain-containing protein, partial [Myxococcota bacterium]|nr:winged helix-turn-helix domain-containing protein [Myxococcota bacterium]
ATEALLLAAPDGAPRRVLGLGARLLDGDERVRLRKTRRRQGRIETLIAVLASAGPEGLPDADCFAQAYEVPYEAEVHRGVFEVLVTRARAYLGDAADIVRGQGHIALRLRSAIAVPDPRCAAPVHDRLLRILAREGRATASETARRMGQSVRAVQDALKSLAEEGACVGEKDGRQIHYTVEDTTFSEPTQRLALPIDRER